MNNDFILTIDSDDENQRASTNNAHHESVENPNDNAELFNSDFTFSLSDDFSFSIQASRCELGYLVCIDFAMEVFRVRGGK